MLYKYFLYFLGLYAWSYKPNTKFEKFMLKKYINLKLLEPLKNNKKLVKLSESNSNSPENNSTNNELRSISISLLKFLDKNKKYKIILYNIYSFCIFAILCIEPFYLFINMCINKNNNFQNIYYYFIKIHQLIIFRYFYIILIYL